MPVLTDIQGYASDLLKKLLYARHDQLHWLIGRMYPDVTPQKVMRQLGYLSKVINDGKHYIWPGCEVNEARVAAIEIMLRLCGGAPPIFETARPPCALTFFLMKQDCMQAFRIYTPVEGQETQCRAIAEQQRDPKGHAVVFYIDSRSQIPLLGVSHPHIFAVSDGAGGFTFQEAKL